MVPQLPITVFKVRLHESHYKTGFLDLQSLGTFFFFPAYFYWDGQNNLLLSTLL